MELELQGASSDDEKQAIKQRYAEMAKNVEMEFELDELAFQEQIKAEMDKDKQKEKEIILRAFVTDAARNKSELIFLSTDTTLKLFPLDSSMTHCFGFA